MKKIYLLIFMLCISFCSFAEELKFLTGGKYVKGKHYKTILRPLKEFKVGKKYCLYGTKNWDEACQDTAFEYAFGENWREFKRVALEFIEAQKTQDIEKMRGLWSIPCGVTVSNGYHEDGTIKYRWPGADNDEELKDLLEYEVLAPFGRNKESFKNLSYEKFLIEDIWEGKFYTVSLSKYLNIYFEVECTEFRGDICVYSPKIRNFRY